MRGFLFVCSSSLASVITFIFFTIYTLINAFLTQNKGLYFVRIHVYEVADNKIIPGNRFRSIQVL